MKTKMKGAGKKAARKINRDEPWFEQLRAVLNGRFSTNLTGYSRQVRNRAVKEIIQGISTCIEKKLRVSVTLRRTFDISSNCNCLIAKNSKAGEYDLGLAEYDIPDLSAGRNGFEPSDVISDLLEKIGSHCKMTKWSEIYNDLWRAAGKFFKQNHQFGVN